MTTGDFTADLDAAADLATHSPYPNPAPLTRAGVRRLLEDAFYGRRPASGEPIALAP